MSGREAGDGLERLRNQESSEQRASVVSASKEMRILVRGTAQSVG